MTRPNGRYFESYRRNRNSVSYGRVRKRNGRYFYVPR